MCGLTVPWGAVLTAQIAMVGDGDPQIIYTAIKGVGKGVMFGIHGGLNDKNKKLSCFTPFLTIN